MQSQGNDDDADGVMEVMDISGGCAVMSFVGATEWC